VYFVTCCTYERQTLLANEFIHQAFVDFVKRGFSGSSVAVGRYVLMPDHMHFFVRGPHDFRLSVWVNQLKGFLTKRIRVSRPQGDCYRDRSRSPAANVNGQVWQRGFFDHVLRSHESYSEKWRYVEQNPVRAGLVENAVDWPYAGQIMEIRL
jgi:REP element-mobilizing transposase RayT